MTSREDKRNLKCLFGMHQWREINSVLIERFEEETDKIPYRIFRRYNMQCVFCGRLKKVDI